jgi:hypothetical protein
MTSFYSGAALDICTRVDGRLVDRAPNVPIRVGKGSPPSGQGTEGRWFDTRGFVNPPVGVYGDAAPGIVRGPGSQN